MAQGKILAVDDEPDILELVQYHLGREGYQVLTAADGTEALRLARSEQPDLIVLDLMLPGMSGLDVCRELKRDPELSPIAILMFTARNEEADVVVGLELGADDYVTKPVSPRVLTARVKAVLRRRASPPAEPSSLLRLGELVIDPGRRAVTAAGQPVDLTFTEFEILHSLARRPGWVFTRYQIVEAVQGEHYPVTDRSVDVHIVNLRRKLGPAGRSIETVRRVGYRFRE